MPFITGLHRKKIWNKNSNFVSYRQSRKSCIGHEFYSMYYGSLQKQFGGSRAKVSVYWTCMSVSCHGLLDRVPINIKNGWTGSKSQNTQKKYKENIDNVEI